MENLLLLAGFEVVKVDRRLLCPIRIPLISNFLNRFVAPLPLFGSMAMMNLLVARPVFSQDTAPAHPSVSVIVPARNEAGNIENAVLRLPVMGPDDELIFVEGNSSDNTWEKIRDVRGNTDQVVASPLRSRRVKGRATRCAKDFPWLRRIF